MKNIKKNLGGGKSSPALVVAQNDFEEMYTKALVQIIDIVVISFLFFPQICTDLDRGH